MVPPKELSDGAIHVLLIDDVVTSLRFSQRLLNSLNFKVTTCTSGERGLELLNENPNSFDLLLLDVLMPGVDGLEVLTRIKSSDALKHIPVVMLSGLDDQGLAEECLQKGAVEVLIKPLVKDAVIRVINTYCKHPTEPYVAHHTEIPCGEFAPCCSRTLVCFVQCQQGNHGAAPRRCADRRQARLVHAGRHRLPLGQPSGSCGRQEGGVHSMREFMTDSDWLIVRVWENRCS